jgi:hypothetical protein
MQFYEYSPEKFLNVAHIVKVVRASGKTFFPSQEASFEGTKIELIDKTVVYVEKEVTKVVADLTPNLLVGWP